MSILDLAKADTKTINEDRNGFALELKWTSPTNVSASINGRHVKHHLGLTPEGGVVNTKIASVSFSEDTMVAAGYTIRDTSGEVNMKGWRVEVKDSTTNFYKYIVTESFPDETLGMIVCILNAFE